MLLTNQQTPNICFGALFELNALVAKVPLPNLIQKSIDHKDFFATSHKPFGLSLEVCLKLPHSPEPRHMHGFRANGNVLITSYRRYHARRRLFHIACGMEGVGRDSLCGKVLLPGKQIRKRRYNLSGS